MSNAQNDTPRDYLIETIATLLLGVGGYKDAAEATLFATDLFADLTSTDPQDIAEAATELRRLAIQADGVSNAIEANTQDDADESVRFVKDEGEHLPEGDVAPGPQSFEDLLRAIFGQGVTFNPLTAELSSITSDIATVPASPTPTELYAINPFGGFTRVG